MMRNRRLQTPSKKDRKITGKRLNPLYKENKSSTNPNRNLSSSEGRYFIHCVQFVVQSFLAVVGII